MSNTVLEGSSDSLSLHTAIVECVESFFDALEMIRPTPSNDCGDPGHDHALVKLSRWGVSLAPFPHRRLDPDPFITSNGVIQLPMHEIGKVSGSSLYDVWLRIVGRAYDALRIVPTYTFIDPSTGDPFEGVKYSDGSAGKTDNGNSVARPGAPENFHFTALPWAAELWEHLIVLIVDQSIGHFGFPRAPEQFLDRIRPSLAVEYHCARRDVISSQKDATKSPPVETLLLNRR